jgi:deoxyribose-phosphate aldolase
MGKKAIVSRASKEPPPRAEVLAAIEHTLLAPDATPARIDALCGEALRLGFGAVCVNPIFVARCRAQLGGAGVRVRVVSVVGFPLGAQHTQVKQLETELALCDGADEIDMVMPLGAAKAGAWQAVIDDARGVVEAARGKPVKLIIETGLLDEAEKRAACQAALRARVAFVKTCTGFAAGAATVEDVTLLRAVLDGGAAIKASGGIRSAGAARALLAAGALRLGTSSGVKIAAELEQE